MLTRFPCRRTFPDVHTFVQDESTYVRYSLSYILMGDPLLLTLFLCFIELLVVNAEFVVRSEVLTNVVST
jgi:hypothetical protein